MKIKKNNKAPNFRLPSTDKSIFELNKIKKKTKTRIKISTLTALKKVNIHQ